MFVRSLPTCRRAVARAALARSLQPLSPYALTSRTRSYASSVSGNGVTQLKPSIYGQPLASSHPHLLSERETTPGIPQKEYDRRRRELMQSLPEGSLVVCVAGQVKYMSGRE